MSKRTPVTVILGRFQPPTIGHYHMIDEAKKVAMSELGKKLDVEPFPYVAIISGEKTSQDKERNPLTGEERMKFMQASNRVNGVKFVQATNVLEAFHKLREAGKEPMIVVAGEDRGDDYLRLLDKYIKTDDDKPIKHYLHKLSRDADALEDAGAAEETLEHMGDTIDISMVSGSLARLAARKGELAKLMTITGLKEGAARILMKKLKEATNGAA